MSHIYHPRTGADDEPLFFDECAECRHHADDPITYLDDERLVRLWNEMVRVEAENDHTGYRSVADAHAAHHMREASILLLRLPDGVRPFKRIEEPRKLSSA